MSSRALTPAEIPRFDVAQAVTPVGTAPCAECRSAIVDTYFEWDGKVICATCQARVAQSLASPRHGSTMRAVGLGTLAAVASAVAYYAMTSLAHRDIAVTSLLVGFVIGKAVRVGSGHRGGRRYQWLAAGVTYATIASTYLPFVTSGLGTGAPAHLAALLLLAGAAPVLAGFSNVAIIAITILAVLIAWRMNRALPAAIAGPFRAGGLG